jgi:hypothetical protein
MLPHRLDENLSFCPRDVRTYAALHMDSIAKILNHILLLLFALNILLFLSCWSQSFTPSNTLPTVWMSLFLLLQNATVWAILNNGRVSPHLSFLAPNDFIMGLALGITIGASILSFLLSQSFRYGSCPTYSRTTSNRTNYDYAYEHSTSTTSNDHYNDSNTQTDCHHSTGIWLWAGLVFWLNFCSCLLLAVGRREFTHSPFNSTEYEPVGTADPMYMNHHGGGGGYNHTVSTSTGFAGDYANVPEIRPDHDGRMNGNSSHGSVSSTSEAAKILSV